MDTLNPFRDGGRGDGGERRLSDQVHCYLFQVQNETLKVASLSRGVVWNEVEGRVKSRTGYEIRNARGQLFIGGRYEICTEHMTGNAAINTRPSVTSLGGLVWGIKPGREYALALET